MANRPLKLNGFVKKGAAYYRAYLEGSEWILSHRADGWRIRLEQWVDAKHQYEVLVDEFSRSLEGAVRKCDFYEMGMKAVSLGG